MHADKSNGSDNFRPSVVDEWNYQSKHVEDQRIPIDQIQGTYSPRSTVTSISHVTILTQSPTNLPPIVVHKETMRVIDGVHRLKVHEGRGDTSISVLFFTGTEEDAFALAVHLNVMHGLPLTLRDRKAAAQRILEANPARSDRGIGLLTGLSHKTVAAIRRRSTGETAQSNIRLGQDGRRRSLSAAEGRRRAAKVVSADPSASLRNIARAADVSISVARDVRTRVRRGEDPLPQRLRSRADRQLVGRELKPASSPNDHNRDSGPPNANPSHYAADLLAESIVEVRNRSTALLTRLKNDPTMRFKDSGRSLLRHLSMSLVDMSEVYQGIDSIPLHCTGLVLELALNNAKTWALIANHIDAIINISSAQSEPVAARERA